uniref:Carbohydrate kinase PfkB domain-containing protein n=1 Tax=Acrobeloides nanus TaxID=290746 RepID=A0A914DT34_9BILA
NDGGSYIGSMAQRCGGVGRNHADALTRLGCDVNFISVVGNDDSGDYLLRKSSHINLNHMTRLPNVPTATYLSINVKGNIQHGFSSIEENISKLTSDLIRSKEDLFCDADYILIDGNTPVETLRNITDLAQAHHKNVWFDPADLAKVQKVFMAKNISHISVISPNAYEFMNYCTLLGIPLPEQLLTNSDAMLDFCNSLGPQLKALFPGQLSLILLTLGNAGILALQRHESSIEIVPWPAPQLSQALLVSPSGAGDCFNAGFLTAYLKNLSFHDCLRIGTECAKLSLMSIDAVPNTITSQLLGT